MCPTFFSCWRSTKLPNSDSLAKVQCCIAIVKAKHSCAKINNYLNKRKELIVFLILGDNESFRRAVLSSPSPGRCVVSGAEIRVAGGGTRRRILTTFMKEPRAQAMTSWGKERRPANVPPAESRRWRGKRDCLSLSGRLRFGKDHARPNGMEINYTRGSIGSEI